MSLATFSIDDARAVAMLDRLRASGANTRKLNDEIGDAFVEIAALSFHDAADPWGTAWAPLSPVTIQRRRQKSDKPLNDFGFLRASIESRASAAGVEVSIGRADRPATPHQFGNPLNRMFGGALAPIPARPMLPLDEAGVRLAGTGYEHALQDLVDDYLDEAVS